MDDSRGVIIEAHASQFRHVPNSEPNSPGRPGPPIPSTRSSLRVPSSKAHADFFLGFFPISILYSKINVSRRLFLFHFVVNIAASCSNFTFSYFFFIPTFLDFFVTTKIEREHGDWGVSFRIFFVEIEFGKQKILRGKWFERGQLQVGTNLHLQI